MKKLTLDYKFNVPSLLMHSCVGEFALCGGGHV